MKRLPEVIEALNREKTRFTGRLPVDAIKEKVVDAKSLNSYSRPVGLREKRLDSSNNMRYLCKDIRPILYTVNLAFIL